MSNIYDFNRKAKSDDRITNSFTEEHLQIASDNFKRIRNTWANGVLNKQFKHIQLRPEPEKIDRKFIQFDSDGKETVYKNRTQKSRRGGVNPLEKEIHTSICDLGYYVDIQQSVVYSINRKSFRYVTGQTRDGALEIYNFTNMLGYVLEAQTGDHVTQKGIDQELALLGILLNPKPLPEAPSSMADIVQYGLNSCDQRDLDISRVTEGQAYDMISDYIDEPCEVARLSKPKKTICIQSILNQAKDYDGSKVYPMSGARATLWLKENNYINIPNKLRYIVGTSSMPEIALMKSILIASQFPKEEIRLVVQCEVLGADAMTTFETRMKDFWNKKNAFLSGIQQVIFNGKTKDIQNWVLYGSPPQIEKHYNMTKIVKYNQLDGSLKQ
jgi:hypothetical protein